MPEKTQSTAAQAPPHQEGHFESTETVRDVVIGMSDGLTVPFALAAGLSGAVNSSHVVVLAGLAEIAAGSIAMGLGGFLAAQGDAEHYASERLREEREVVERTRDEEEEIYEIFEQYGVEREESMPVLEALKRNPPAWVDFMMRFELGLEEPQRNRASRSALTIALSYIVGGLIPLAPYMFWSSPTALEGVRRHNAACAAGVRRNQGQTDQGGGGAQRHPDGSDRRIGGRRSLSAGAAAERRPLGPVRAGASRFVAILDPRLASHPSKRSLLGTPVSPTWGTRIGWRQGEQMV